jgi:hypothetical protein
MLIHGGAFVLGIAGATPRRRNGLAWRTDAISGAPLEVIADELERGDFIVLDTLMKPMITQVAIITLKHRKLAPAAMELIELLTEG